MFPPENEGKPVKVKNILRRPFGVAALDVTNILNGNISPDEDKQHFVPILPYVMFVIIKSYSLVMPYYRTSCLYNYKIIFPCNAHVAVRDVYNHTLL